MQPLTLQPYFMPNLPNPFSPKPLHKPSQEIACSITFNIPGALSQQTPLTSIFKQTLVEPSQTNINKVESATAKPATKYKVKRKKKDEEEEYLPENDRPKKKRRKSKNDEEKSIENKVHAQTVESNKSNSMIINWNFVLMKQPKKNN